MTEPNEFRTDRDPTVGQALRDALDVSGEASFTARVMARIGLEAEESSWDVLARWAPLGMAAAALVALAAGLGLGLMWSSNSREVAAGPDPTVWLSTGEPVTTELVLTAVVSGGGLDENGDQ